MEAITTSLPARLIAPIQCRRCDRTVTWARTRSGKRIQMDFRPVPSGEYCIVGVDPPHMIVGKASAMPDGAARYMCHFDTCPNKRLPKRNYRRRLTPEQARIKREWDARALGTKRVSSLP